MGSYYLFGKESMIVIYNVYESVHLVVHDQLYLQIQSLLCVDDASYFILDYIIF